MYVPVLERLDEGLLGRMEAADCVFVDGTFWRDDELAAAGIGGRTAKEMGHLPLSGPGGSLERLAALRGPRTILLHINNTNPILLDDSPERRAVEAAGVEVAYDGMLLEL
jgi:pyrroloquinoline quinone biosynthesis protein B